MKAVDNNCILRYTYNDYINWEGRWERISGVPYAMSHQPSTEHQEISKNILIHLSNVLKECQKCTVLLPVGWKIDEGAVVQPDISMVCNDINEKKYLTHPPENIFEILPPSSAFKDRNIKYKLKGQILCSRRY